MDFCSLILIFSFAVTAALNPPVIKPSGGFIHDARTISIVNSGADTNATIFYTVQSDNDTKTITPLRYNGPFLLDSSAVVSAFSVAHADTSPTTLSRFVKIAALPPPRIERLTNSDFYTLVQGGDSLLSSAAIFYTTDGRDPSIYGKEYTGELFSTPGTEIKAVTHVRGGRFLTSAQSVFVIDSSATPQKSELPWNYRVFDTESKDIDSCELAGFVIKTERGERKGEYLFSIESASVDGSIIYTLDGSEPRPGAFLWGGRPVTVKVPVRIRARRLFSGLVLGAECSVTLAPQQLLPPVADKPSGTIFTKNTHVTLRRGLGADDSSTQIIYTDNGSDPMLFGKVYDEPILINKNTLIKAFVQGAGYTSSSTATFNYLHSIAVVSAYYLDSDNDGHFDKALCPLSAPAHTPPRMIRFTDPFSGSYQDLYSSSITLSVNHDTLICQLPRPFTKGTVFEPGRYGEIPILGDYSTAPFFIYPPSRKNRSTGEIDMDVVNNPFDLKSSSVPIRYQSTDVKSGIGCVIIARPHQPSYGVITIYDSAGSAVLSKREMSEEDATGTLYFVWDGHDLKGRTVHPGTYLAIVAGEEKLGGGKSSGKAFITVTGF